MSASQNVSLLTNNAGKLVSNPTDMCQVLADGFSKYYPNSSAASQTFIAGPLDINDALHVVIDQVIVFKALSKVKLYAAGPDNLPGILINKLAGPPIRPLTELFH